MNLKIVLLFFLQTTYFTAVGQFSYFNPQTKLHEKFDLEKEEFLNESALNHWEKPVKMVFVGIVKSDLPTQFKVNFFKKGYDSTYFTLSGTGQVYLLIKSKNTLKRLDKTFYRGHNFRAFQYLKNDTLFSLGGIGFWSRTKFLTYFDHQTSEWELVQTTGEHPSIIEDNNSGWDVDRNIIYVLNSINSTDDKMSFGFEVFGFNSLSNVWKKLGHVDEQKIVKYVGKTPKIKFLTNKFYFYGYGNLLIADPIKNQIFLCKSSKSFLFDKDIDVFSDESFIFSLINISPNNTNNAQKIVQINIKNLLGNAKLLGVFYTVESKFDYGFLIILILSLLLFCSFIFNTLFFLKYKKKQNLLHVEKLPIGGKEFLIQAMKKGRGYQFTVLELTEIMGFSDYSFDGQRQYRSKFIISMNKYFHTRFGIENFIHRISSNTDKRYILYSISEDIFDNPNLFLNS